MAKGDRVSRGKRNVTIRGDVRGSIIVTGDDNEVTQTNQGATEDTDSAALPQPDPSARQLFEALRDRFSLDEVRTLCFDLGLDFDSLGGEGKLGKARELVRLMQRRDALDRLAAAIRQAHVSKR